jgi:hypothetical protein
LEEGILLEVDTLVEEDILFEVGNFVDLYFEVLVLEEAEIGTFYYILHFYIVNIKIIY